MNSRDLTLPGRETGMPYQVAPLPRQLCAKKSGFICNLVVLLMLSLLSLGLLEGQTVELSWYPNGDSDLAGYQVYRSKHRFGYLSLL
jgi:hypothetical protein